MLLNYLWNQKTAGVTNSLIEWLPFCPIAEPVTSVTTG
jgi:hypothetical protein